MSSAPSSQGRIDLALDALHAGRIAEGMGLLQAAEQDGLRDASLVLGNILLRGAPVAADPPRGVRHLENATTTPWGPPEQLLAAILFIGHGVEPDRDRAWHWLGRALDADHPPALRLCGLLRASAGDASGARQWLERARDGGDAFAGHSLALLSAVQGDAAAAKAGFAAGPLPISARRIHEAANGAAPIVWPMTGARWDRADGRPPWCDPVPQGVVETLSESPRIALQHAAVSPWECDYLMTVVGPDLRRSTIIDPRDGKMVLDPIRSSSDANLRRMYPDIIIHGVAERMAALAGLPVERSEGLAMLRYGVGEEYRIHHDSFTPSALANHPSREQGQRVATVIAYLTAVAGGGLTAFPELGLRVVPEPGALLYFDNVRPDGARDARTRHVGEPVLAGDKWIVTSWLRERAAVSFDHGQVPGRPR